MKQFEKFFNLPPHLVTQWDDIKALYIKDNTLHVALHEGETILIPHLNQEMVEQIFIAYGKHMNEEAEQSHSLLEAIKLPFPGGFFGAEIGIDLPFKVSEGFQSIVHHDPKGTKAPDLPKELLDKLSRMAQMMLAHNPQAFSKAEADCNCFHCQIARELVQQTLDAEDVHEEDLHFAPEWDVTPIDHDEKRYRVASRLNPDQSYQVHLGNPIGCTCGKNNCEHIIAALKS
ncbi:MAG: hypothetical protein KDK65_01145 [Chlamydiia bacterium]|nr:hypothetical protein [Chlamydiia bacterium]